MITIALVGRSNVGKSTLFNRLSISARSIVSPQLNVTRDRKLGIGRIADIQFNLLDTPGIETFVQKKEQLQNKVFSSVNDGIQEADIIAFVIDGTVGFTSLDESIYRYIRHKKNIILLVNKSDKKILEEKKYNIFSNDRIVYISGLNGSGILDLYNIIFSFKNFFDIFSNNNLTKKDYINITIIGRPNAGKSSFINKLLGKERLVIGEEAGITRDAIEIKWNYKDKNICLIDTAGLRRKSRIQEELEHFSVNDTIANIKKSDVVLMLLDGTNYLENQDLKIIGLVQQIGKSMVLVINKVDLLDKCLKEIEADVKYKFRLFAEVPVIFVSALKDPDLTAVVDSALEVYDIASQKISTGKLNSWLQKAIKLQKPPLMSNKRPLKLKYCICLGTNPIKIRIFCNNSSQVPTHYKRYLENSFLKYFSITGISVKFYFTSGENPYVK